jgi:CRISPR-associated protein Csb2
MFALLVNLLSGRYVATRYNDRDVAEWPPHPARLFSALVASWAENEPDSPQGVEELRALEWLEAQPAPNVVADVIPEGARAGRRTVSTVFVPVNDAGVVQQPENQRTELAEAVAELATADGNARPRAEKAVKKAAEALAKRTAAAVAPSTKPSPGTIHEALSLLPEGRKRQGRTFPSITPSTPQVELRWEQATLPQNLDAPMRRLLARVIRLGHSSSFVDVRIVEEAARPPPERTYKPSPSGACTLRWISAGQTARLLAYHDQHSQVEPRVMPCTFVSYEVGEVRAHAPVVESLFNSQWLVLARVSGPRFPISSVVGVARQLNRAMQSVLGAHVPELLSGHRNSGEPSELAHAAIVPLPFVGSPHADGGILGIGVILPRRADDDQRAAVMRSIARLSDDDGQLRLLLGDSGQLVLERVGWELPKQRTLWSETWTRPATEWVTATPIALDVNPGNLHDPDPTKRARAFSEAEESVRLAAERIGLPRPASVEVSRSVLLPGAAKPRSYPRFPISKDRPQRVLVHARILFSQPVAGPVLLGAGRYTGLGLCRPVAQGEGS